MEATLLKQLVTLRTVVGYLGERDQYGWWQSSFFAPGSQAFLAPMFGRTQLLAQCNGVTRAAAVVHDERIGVGNVYHLFRLPEDIEQALHRSLHGQELKITINALCASKEAAFDYLRKEARALSNRGMGPTSVGATHSIHHQGSWRGVAALYLHACDDGLEVYPYFADKM